MAVLALIRFRLAACGGLDLVARLGQAELHDPAQAIVIVYEENRWFFHDSIFSTRESEARSINHKESKKYF